MIINPVKVSVRLLVACMCFCCFAFPLPSLSEERERSQVSQSSAESNGNQPTKSESVDSKPNPDKSISRKKPIDLLIDGQWKNENKDTGVVTVYTFGRDEKSDMDGRITVEYLFPESGTRIASFKDLWKFQLRPDDAIAKASRLTMTPDSVSSNSANAINAFYEISQDGKELCIIYTVQGRSFPNKFEKENCRTFMNIKEPKKAS